MRDPDCYSVYIMSNKLRTALYIGMTGDLEGRVWEHRNKTDPKCFTARYSLVHLMWSESFPAAMEAISYEKQLKGWTRVKKNALIAERNPQWMDLSRNDAVEVAPRRRNTGFQPVRKAGILPAGGRTFRCAARAGWKPTVRTGWKPVFRRSTTRATASFRLSEGWYE